MPEPYFYIRTARYMGTVTPWTLAGIEEAYPLVYECFSVWAWESEQAEIQAKNIQQQPAGQYANLILGGKSLGATRH